MVHKNNFHPDKIMSENIFKADMLNDALVT